MRHVRYLSSLAVVMAILLSVGAQCLAAQEITAVSMDCCADTARGEDAAALQADCCDAQDAPAQLTASTSVLLPALTAVVSPVAFVPEPRALTWGHVDFERSPLKLDGTPTYLRLSTFRI